MRMRILAVDDNAANLTTIQQELQDYYEVITMLTGRRALKYLYQESVDLILLDVEMPIMDGIDTLREIRSLENGVGATIPVIFLTAKKDKATVIAGAQLGIMDYITKPFDGKELYQRIEQVFMRLGKQEIPIEMLHNAVKETLSIIKSGRRQIALTKLDEMSSYQTREDIHERIRHARIKYMESDAISTVRMLDRLNQLLEKEAQTNQQAAYAITNADLRSHILFVLSDIENFDTESALERIDALDQYDVPEEYSNILKKAKKLLEEYDDITAEQVLRDLNNSIPKY